MATRRVTAAAAELTVAALTVVAALNMERLFTDSSALAELVTVAVLGHVVALTTRRAGMHTIVAASLCVAVTALGIKLLLYPETAFSVDGARATVSLLGEDLDLAWDLFQTKKAPVEPVRGLVTAAAAVLGGGAFVADWAAFRLRSTMETLIGPTAVFVFASMLGSDDLQVAYGVLYAASAAALIVVMKASRRAGDEVWVANGAARGVMATGLVGCAMIAAAVTVGAVAGPEVPGAGEDVWELGEIEDQPEVRAVVSPLVEVRPMLVDQSDFEIFSVTVDRADRDYWRLMALTEFDGAIWRRHSSFSDVDGSVPTSSHPDLPKRTLRQRITTRRLGNVYLPAAFELQRVIDSGSVVLEYEAATGSLVVDRASEAEAARGFTYTVESAVPDFDAALLPAVATAGIDDGFVAEHTQLPPSCVTGDSARCWPERATALALRVTEGADSDYQKALALQAFFTGPESDFAYDINVAHSHHIDTLSDFLFGERRGYCEQFAAAFAALARSLGIPARVAVGFTWGDWDDARAEYVVKGKHAHAWAELYFAGAGWVAFDPTPGRGPAHGISERPAAQLGENDPLGEEEEGAIAPPSTSVAGNGPPQLDDGSQSSRIEPPGAAADAGAAGAEPSDPADTSPTGEQAGSAASRAARILLRVLAVLAVVTVLLGTVPALKWLARRRRLASAAGDPVRLGELAFDDAMGALRLLGVEPAGSETPPEIASRVLGLRLDPGPIDDLSATITVLRYAPASEASEQHAQAAQRASEGIRRRCRLHAGAWRIALDLIDPRPLGATRKA